jgi:hypothetical protein
MRSASGEEKKEGPAVICTGQTQKNRRQFLFHGAYICVDQEKQKPVFFD